MEKPITLVIEETKTQIIEAANNSCLPAWVISIIMQDIARQAAAVASREHEAAVEAYNKEAENGEH